MRFKACRLPARTTMPSYFFVAFEILYPMERHEVQLHRPNENDANSRVVSLWRIINRPTKLHLLEIFVQPADDFQTCPHFVRDRLSSVG